MVTLKVRCGVNGDDSLIKGYTPALIAITTLPCITR